MVSLGCCRETPIASSADEFTISAWQGNAYRESYLAQARPEFGWAYVEQLAQSPAPEPQFATIDELREKAPAIIDQTRNKIKKCDKCGKVCAWTLAVCNSCGNDLSKTEVSFSPNVFMGFVYGVAKAGFPLTISMRLQRPDIMVFDDLLALSTCHLNVIPADCYIPDWRYLLQDPKRALGLLEKMSAAGWEVVEKMFLANKAWAQQTVNCDDPAVLKGNLMTGMNFPPSQFQLHMQYIVPPLLPFHHYMMRRRNHFTYGRFFPTEYLVSVLQYELKAPRAAGWKDAGSTAIEDIINYFHSQGVEYCQIHHDFIDRVERGDAQMAKWSADAFDSLVLDGSAVMDRKGGKGEGAPGDLQAADKTILQNYGRPYKAGKPTGSYYAHAKKPGEVEVWGA